MRLQLTIPGSNLPAQQRCVFRVCLVLALLIVPVSLAQSQFPSRAWQWQVRDRGRRPL